MPTQVPIEVFLIGRTQVDPVEVERWMDFIGATEFELPEEGLTNPAAIIALAGKRCYMSFEVNPSLNPNITKIRSDYVQYFDNILSSGHGSVLEHSVYNFAIENVSRVFTAEMNRHRAGWAISEGSLRFIRFGENIPYWLPDSIKGPDRGDPSQLKSALGHIGGVLEHQRDAAPADVLADAFESNGLVEAYQADPLALKKELTRTVFHIAFRGQEHWYRTMEAIWHEELAPESKFANKKNITSMMRRIVGLGVATGGVWSGNIRALRHVFTMRASKQAEEEMLHVFSRVAKVMVEKEPLLFGDFTQTEEGFWVPKYVKV
jgi:thymidylate synthase (FAD)